MQIEFGVEEYLRYRDDILILGTGRGAVRFVHRMQELCQGVYNVHCETVSRHSISFLDFELIKDHTFFRTGHLSYKLYVKPTAQHVPLASNSNHHVSVHWSWPCAEVHRIARRSSSHVFFNHAKSSLLQKLGAHNIAEPILLKAGSLEFQNARFSGRNANGRDSKLIFRLVIPFVRSLHCGEVLKFLKDHCRLWSDTLGRVLNRVVEVRLVYKSAFPNLGCIVNRTGGPQ